MDRMRPLGGAAVVLVFVILCVSVFSAVFASGLFTGADDVSSTAALVATLALVGAVLAFIASGQPWKDWQRTAYW